MQEQKFDMEQYIDQMALLLELQIQDEYRHGVIANFERIKAIAQLVNEFELPEQVQVAPIFEP